MVGRLSAQLALFAFALAICAGLYAGNGVITVLTRAIVTMFVIMAVTQFVAWTSKLILRDYLQRKKMELDQAHFESIKARVLDQEAATAAAVAQPAPDDANGADAAAAAAASS